MLSDEQREKRNARTRRYRERKRRERGAQVRLPISTPEERIERQRKASRECAERKRRAAGIPEKKAAPPEIRRARRTQLAAVRRSENTLHFREINRKHMTKKRLALTLGVDLDEVPLELFEVKHLQLNVIRLVKELSK